jgi:CheY-like chemotaxis protein
VFVATPASPATLPEITIESTSPLKAPHKASIARRHKILIIDDDQPMVELLSRRLQEQDYHTMVALSGQDGLAAAHECEPALIVLDLRLPDGSGLEFCEQLADHPGTCHIPVIILSGMERPDIIRRSRAAGCQYFVRKPYDPNALLILIQHAIGESQSWQVSAVG